MDTISELYNGTISSAIIFYIINYFNKDIENSTSSYICASVFASISFYGFSFLAVGYPSIASFRIIYNLIMVLLSSIIFLNTDKINSFISVLVAMLMIGIADVSISFLYLYPLKLTLEAYSSSVLHITAGSFIIFIEIWIMLKLLGNKFNNIKNYALTKNYKVISLLLIYLSSIFLLLFISSHILQIYFNNEIYVASFNIILGFVSTFMIVLVSIFILNETIDNEMKLKNELNIYNKDDLTGILNRRAGTKFLEKQLRICRGYNEICSICYLDINSLKLVNDTYGHRQGDKLIVTIVNTVRDNIRKSDEMFRIGGDEFIIVLPGYSIEDAEAVAKRVLCNLEEVRIHKGYDFDIGFSYGCVEYNGENYETIESLLDKADSKMYQFKRSLRNA